MDERKIQRDLVMNLLCRREDEGGLGYRLVTANVVDNGLFIPSVLTEFIRTTQPTAWSELMTRYGGDEALLQRALVKFLREKFTERQNAAIFFNYWKRITFEGVDLTLFYVPGTELRGDEDFEKNVFCAVEEVTYKQQYRGAKITSVRPDVAFYLNGIYLGYMELKSNIMGQNAQNDGCTKVAKDYLTAVRAITERELQDTKVAEQKKSLLALYEKAIHLTASDLNETYVVRNVAQVYDRARSEWRASSLTTIEQVAPQVVELFKPYPVSSPVLTQQERFEEVMRALYAKRAIINEILYYNFIEYKTELRGGKRVCTSRTGRLIAPRPKQKFGCDKIMRRIVEMIDHEHEPNYYTDQLRKELYALAIPQEKTEEIIAQRERFCNNKYVYSLLMQYAAGFGKSNIIGWTALQLKDFRYRGEYAYDKIMLVVDRLQLRSQLEERMYNMNIDRSMYVEAIDRDTFVKALDASQRIIVVNIQKFLDMQQAIDAAGMKLKNMRVAFLIDEIHRSNSGENNREMLNLFERLQDAFNVGGECVRKKNLLIGFTATPSDETLSRFGEFRSATTVPLWVPFDSYTMSEAIADGYILDPTKHIIPYHVPVRFELPDDIAVDYDLPPTEGTEGAGVLVHDVPAQPKAGEQTELPDVKFVKQEVYENEERMRKIADFVVDRLVTLVFGKIRGEGKAMLAVTSIPIAIRYTRLVRQLFAEKCKEKKYAGYAKAPIVGIYSDNQRYESCASLNGGVAEDVALERFKKEKNGLVIVVDKLQTGFDEPKLHTLFLDKEIKDINAIQTISRVNRTCKYKTECHVVDCSYGNVNTKNIGLAFKKFSGMVISQFNPEEEAKEVISLYKQLLATEPFEKWLTAYGERKDEAEFVVEMEDGLRQWVTQCVHREAAIKQQNEDMGLEPSDKGYVQPENAARAVRKAVGQYGSALQSLRNVYYMPPKYSDKTFLDFCHKYCMIYRDVCGKMVSEGYTYKVVDTDELPGITVKPFEDDDEPKKKRKGQEPDKTNPKRRTIKEVLSILKRLNETQQLSTQEVQKWMELIGQMFETFGADEDLCAYLLDEKTADEEKLEQFNQKLLIYKLTGLRDFPDPDKVELFKQLLEDNASQFYAWFVGQLKPAHEGKTDFTMTVETEQPVQNVEELLRAALKKYNPDYDEQRLKEILCKNYAPHFYAVEGLMPQVDEVVDGFFEVLNAQTTGQLDCADGLLKTALNMLLVAEGLTADMKRTHFSQLLMKFEMYLKKLYYLIYGEEMVASDPNMKGATLQTAIMAFKSLRELVHEYNYMTREFKEKLNLLRSWRNDEAHGGVMMAEAEIDQAIATVIDIYLFATGTNMRRLHEVERSTQSAGYAAPQTGGLEPTDDSSMPDGGATTYGYAAATHGGLSAAAESASGWPEAKRREALKQAILQLYNYSYSRKNSKFCRLRHWGAIYRIAADRGLVIDGDYAYFYQAIAKMELGEELPKLVPNFLENFVQGIYADSFADWTPEGLDEAELRVYHDVHATAEVFDLIVASALKHAR